MINKLVKKLILLSVIAAAILSCSEGNPGRSAVPDAPSGLTGEAVGTFSVQLYWNDNSDNEDSFLIYRSVGGPFGLAGTAGSDVSEFLDEIPVSCVEASYYVVAENGSGQSSFSNIAAVPLICADSPDDFNVFIR